MTRTRSDDLCPVFVESETFKDYLLSTYADIYKILFIYIREERLGKNKQEHSLSDMCSPLKKYLKRLWGKIYS